MVVDVDRVGVKTKLFDNIVLHFRGGSRCEGDGGWVANMFFNLFDTGIVRSEIVPPFTDAVRLVNGEQADGAGFDDFNKIIFSKSLRSYI